MKKGSKEMDNKSYEQFIIMQATIEANKQDFDDKMAKLTEYFKAMIASTITSMTDQINLSTEVFTKSSGPYQYGPV